MVEHILRKFEALSANPITPPQKGTCTICTKRLYFETSTNEIMTLFEYRERITTQ
jgi:hypothetical protein